MSRTDLRDRLRDLGFRARRALRWSPPAWKRRAALEAVLRELSPEGGKRLAKLRKRYPLEGWSRCCNLTDWRESLYVLDLLDRLLPRELPPGRALDVGSKNGCYLPGLATALARGWDAVELDAHRRYLWGTTRRAYGEAMASAFEGCRFVAGDLRELEGPWAAVTWFLPFLEPEPLQAWGLPARLLAPLALLRHVTERVQPGGALLIVNQGPEEAELQAELFARLGLEPEGLGRVDSPLSPFRLERHALRWRA